ncbi:MULTISPECIES: hypothetical protein [Roseobacteraceae]|jgi:predicted small secreted protein|uniref:Uncharacterized protein n=1 Tax=Pseudosulfitobacter pseudonitzschiae TaxID=1402135 RepID=A0A221JYL8_9RHOB|nr:MULTISPECIES: hypothetical protein [Roseobacteraceae]ASM71845.1 hypothetical protein SULPSESMR1_01019 [Pseudosulfitobacter pseudonitzschiae]
MADNETPRTTPNEPVHTTTTKSNSSMAFIVGALVVVVGVLAYFIFGGDVETTSGASDVNVTVEGAGDAAQDAGNAIEGAAESTGQAIEGAAESVGDAAESATDGN